MAREYSSRAESDPSKIRQVIAPETSKTISGMLASVVDNGFDKARIKGYDIAGKTGTAQVASPGGYDASKTIGTFAGFGPLDNPRFVIVVKVTNPKAVKFAETTAAPAFGAMAKFLLNYFQIPPTR